LQASSKGLVFIQSYHAGIVIGGVHGTGFAIARTTTGRWSPPCFITLNRVEIGAVLGVETSSTIMAAVTRRGVEELAAGKHQVFGTDVSVQLWPFSKDGSGADDEISLDVSSDWLTASVGRGILFNFSLAGGSLSVDVAKNKRAYGEAGVTAADILHGKVAHQVDMERLYSTINKVAQKALY
jgi:lipid-binding SYLF domain-containing protein